MGEIVLYQNSSDRKKIRKNLRQIQDITETFRLKAPCSIINPTVTLSRQSIGDSWAQANYAYIPRFKRYYFINNITVEHDSLVSVSMSVDPLYTYAAQLLNTQFEIARSESVNSSYFIDNEKALMNRKVVTFLNVGNIPQSQSGKKFTITVAGGV